MEAPVRELTFEERAKYGQCPACGAKHGEACAKTGFPLGFGAQSFPDGGAHLGRLQRAPHRVREVPA